MTKDADEYKTIITFMLTEPAFAYIDKGFLRSVRDHINKYSTITAGQKTAINNIYIKFTSGV